MSEAQKKIESLEQRMTEIGDTRTNVEGLVEKTARIQADLSSEGFDEYAGKLGEAFTSLTMTAEVLRGLHHDMEIERNRIRNEA